MEALCEFQFIPSQPWDITIPGLLYEKINDKFPVKQQQKEFGIGLGVRPKEGGITEHRLELTQPRMQFFRPDKTALVQVGSDLLTINHLKPYPTWELFKPLILNNLRLYEEIAKPKGLKGIGLRYINKMEFHDSPIEMSEYFHSYPLIPKELPQVHDAFDIHIEIPYENRRDRLLLTLSTVASKQPKVISLLLDFGYIMMKPDSVSLDQAADWIEQAHTIVEHAFEATITDKCRDLFGG